jgi:hypothetical protein
VWWSNSDKELMEGFRPRNTTEGGRSCGGAIPRRSRWRVSDQGTPPKAVAAVVEQFRERADGGFPTKEHLRRLSQLRHEFDVKMT